MATGYQTNGDIRMVFDAQVGYGDLVEKDHDLERDPGLETAVIVSLFSNRRAEEGDALPDQDSSREGWWADSLEGAEPHGSKLWLLGREKIVPARLLPRAQQYVKEALQWMIDDGAASEINVTATRYSRDTIRIAIEVVRPEIDRPEFYTYYYNWVEQAARSG